MKIKITLLSILALFLFFCNMAAAQENKQMTRIAKVQIDPAQLGSYTSALREQMNTAIKMEPGVLSYYAVAEKAHPENITIFEIYADTAAYQSHIQTPHFKKYKSTVEHMVKHLELIDVTVVANAKKPGL